VPKVWSSVVRLHARERTAQVGDEGDFLELLRALFAQRRKTIHNNLRAARTRLGIADNNLIVKSLEGADLDGRRRAETLTVEETARLSRALQATAE